jgi:hypothetical protein
MDNRRMIGTLQAASTAIASDIFDRPRSRSRNTIGTSTISSPARAARKVSSIWNAYPRLRTGSFSRARSAGARKHLKPPVRSVRRRPRMAAA